MHRIKAGAILVPLLLATFVLPTTAADPCGGSRDEVANFGGNDISTYRNCNRGEGRVSITVRDPVLRIPSMQMHERAISGLKVVVEDDTARVFLPAVGVDLNGQRLGIEKVPELGCVASADRDGRHYRVCHFVIG